MIRFMLGGLALAIFFAAGTTTGQEKGKQTPAKEIFSEEGKLTDSDPRDNKFEKSYQKTHTVKLEAGQLVRIDLKSKDFDTYLRLLDAKGKVLAEDDDSGGDLNSRIIYKVDAAGEYKLVVTSYDPEKTGNYKLTVVEGAPRDLFVIRGKKLLTMDKKAKSEFVADFKKYLTEKGGDVQREDAQLAYQIALGLEGTRSDLAADACSEFGKLLAKSSDKMVAKASGTLIGVGRRLKLPGNEMLVKGTTMEGKPFDWKTYRGKVVLVDFWATWCGPCRAEIPNMRKLLDTYKDQGFEIVGISVDHNRDDLEKFLDKEKLPWLCLHEKDSKEGNPLSVYYGIMSIPLAVLVDRDGKVISLQARGPELARLLEKHIGAPKTPEK